MSAAAKPLGGKAYGSIPHLPGSRLGVGDHHCHAGQEAICWHQGRDGDRVIVTEKLDGSCVVVANVGGGNILALNRAGHLATSSPHDMHHMFAAWVAERERIFANVLRPGERLCGEWLAQAHATRYDLAGRSPFVAFDLIGPVGRLTHDYMVKAAADAQLPHARVLHDGGPVSLYAILPLLAESGHGALDPVEGAVWRVERHGRFDFLAKWVRHDKVDGALLPSVTGNPPVWNWRPA